MFLPGAFTRIAAVTTLTKFTAADYRAAQWLWLRKHPFSLVRRFGYHFVILLGALGAVASDPRLGESAVFVAIAAAGFFAIAVLSMWVRWSRRYSKTAWMHETITVTVDGNGIRFEGPGLRNARGWNQLRGVWESSAVWLFAIGEKKFLFLPKHNLGIAQIEDVRNQIRTYARGKYSLAASTFPG